MLLYRFDDSSMAMRYLFGEVLIANSLLTYQPFVYRLLRGQVFQLSYLFTQQ